LLKIRRNTKFYLT